MAQPIRRSWAARGLLPQGMGAVAAGARGITVGKDIAAENIITGTQVTHMTHVVSYDTAFERVAGSITFVLTQLELSYRQQGWYRLSAVAAAAGFLMIVGGVIAVLAARKAIGSRWSWRSWPSWPRPAPDACRSRSPPTA